MMESKRIINSLNSLTIESIPDLLKYYPLYSVYKGIISAQGLKTTLLSHIKTRLHCQIKESSIDPDQPKSDFHRVKINSFLWVVLLQSTLQIKGFAANVCKHSLAELIALCVT